MNTNNPTQQERRSIFATIKRWFGNKAENANDAMDDSVPVEVQLDRHIKNMQAEYDRIINDKSLMELKGTLKQTDDELKAKRKLYANANYEIKIQTLVDQDKDEDALRYLTEKEDLEAEIAELKEMKVEYSEMDEKVTEDLNRLERDIKESKKTLLKLKSESQQAKKKEEMYKLMNKVSSITTDTDTSNIKSKIDEQKRVAYGTESEYNRRNTGKRIDEDLRKADLKSKLDAYRK